MKKAFQKLKYVEKQPQKVANPTDSLKLASVAMEPMKQTAEFREVECQLIKWKSVHALRNTKKKLEENQQCLYADYLTHMSTE